MRKTVKIIFFISIILSVLFIALYFILGHQAAVCDPVWEIKRHNALLNASKNFLYAFFSTFTVAVATGSTFIVLKYKERKK